MSAPDFPKRLPEKLKAIRKHLGMTPDQLAPFVNARTGAEMKHMRMTKTIYFESLKSSLMPDYLTVPNIWISTLPAIHTELFVLCGS